MDELLGALFAYIVRQMRGRARRIERDFVPRSAAPVGTLPLPPPSNSPMQAARPVADVPVEIRRPPRPPRVEPHEPVTAALPVEPGWVTQFRTPQGLLGAIVASEVLGPPKSLR